MRSEIVLETRSRDVLAELRRQLLPFTQHTIRTLPGEIGTTVYYLKPPTLKNGVLSVVGVPFLVVGNTRRPHPAEEVFHFEASALDETRTKVYGECTQEDKALEEIFEKVWSSVNQ